MAARPQMRLDLDDSIDDPIDGSTDDAADTQRMLCPDFDFDRDTDVMPVAVPIYDIGSTYPESRLASDRAAARRLLIHGTRQNIARLRDALSSGWDVGPELAYEVRRLVSLETEAGWAG